MTKSEKSLEYYYTLLDFTAHLTLEEKATLLDFLLLKTAHGKKQDKRDVEGVINDLTVISNDRVRA